MYFFCFLVKQILELVYVYTLFGRDKYTVVVHAAHPCFSEIIERDVFAGHGRKVVRIFGSISEGVYLVEDHDHRLFRGIAYIGQSLVDYFYLFLEIGMADIHHMYQNIRLTHFVESRFEGVYKMRRQFADESDCVRQQKRQIFYNHLAYGSVECGKEFVLGEDIALAEKIHECRFADIGISDESYTGKFSAIFPLHYFLLVNGDKFLFETGDLVENYASVRLYLCLAGATHAYTAALAFKVCPHAGKTGKQILVLRKFHLSTGCGGLRPFCKYVENQTCAVKNFDFKLFLDVGDLF